MATAELPATTSETKPTPLWVGPGDAGRRMSLDEFIAVEHDEGFFCELARGVLTELPMPDIYHGQAVGQVSHLFHLHRPKATYIAGGACCRISLPDRQSHRRPDQALYLLPIPKGSAAQVWRRWVPQIVVEVADRSSLRRDYEEKSDEYLGFGVVEYWIFNLIDRTMRVHRRDGDRWAIRDLAESQIYRTELLPGLVVSVGDILGTVEDEDDEDDDDESISGPLP